MSGLDHANVVRVYDVDQMGDMIVVAMEFLEGDSLAEVVGRNSKLPVAQACRYIVQAAQGLQHAHEHGLRCTATSSPDNLRLGVNGEVKVVDFGLVRSLKDTRAADDLTGEERDPWHPRLHGPRTGRRFERKLRFRQTCTPWGARSTAC